MKNRICAIFFALFLLLGAIPVSANNVSTMDIDVVLRDDGSAYITQVWDGKFDEGTENYIPIENLDNMEISDLIVSDKNGEYTNIGNWDIDASFDEKARKCGINKTDNGVELCFGISEYGENRYSIEYVVSNLAKAYTDSDGFNFMFVNRGMNIFPTDARIRITLQNGKKLEDEVADIWGFGFNGQVEFQNGTVTAYTTSPLEGDNAMIVMMGLNKGVISPAFSVDESFEDVKQEALEDSTYNGEADWFGYLILFAIFVAILLVILFIILYIKRKIEIKNFVKSADYFRETPNNGDIEMAYYLSQTFDIADDESLIIGALILKLINNGNLQTIKEESVGILGKVKSHISLKLAKEPEGSAESTLYDILSAASGDDGILQEKELEKYSNKHSEKLRKFIDNSEFNGMESFSKAGGFNNGVGNSIKSLSANGKKLLSEVAGLKKYLLDFSLIAEREIQESIIWQDYMVYAALFGIADTVIEQFKKIYPAQITEIETYNQSVLVAYAFNASLYRGLTRAESSRSTGGGGMASLGGGGGFSGGGMGGGSR